MRDYPKVKLPPSRWIKFTNLSILLIILSTFLYVILSFNSLPDRIPIHFNLKGEADGWANKGMIFLLPLINIPTTLLVYAFSKSPELHNYNGIKVTEENALPLYLLSRKILTIVNIDVAILFAILVWWTVQTAKGNQVISFWYLMAVPILVLIIMSIYGFRQMNKIKKQYADEKDIEENISD